MYICTPMFLLLRSLLFLMPAESAHGFTMAILTLVNKLKLIPVMSRLLSARIQHSHVEIMGLTFRNRLGLAAGFDKNAEYLDVFDSLGFGFVEVGTVTPKAQEGNPKPRLFRLPADHALINRMGFNNEGVEAMIDRLKYFRSKRPNTELIIGGNIGKNKITPNSEAADDYKTCFKKLYPLVDYFVVNVSSPNTPNLRELQDKEPLRKIFQSLQSAQQEIIELNPNQVSRPVLVKISPDNAKATVDDILDLVQEFSLAGVVSSNTTIERTGLKTSNNEVESMGNGGLSGKPLKKRSDDLIAYLRKRNPTMTIFGVGGVESAEDALAKREAGSDLIQVYTGFIYEGPKLMARASELLSF
jgi:dihydroorotate dehydrogenase